MHSRKPRQRVGVAVGGLSLVGATAVAPVRQACAQQSHISFAEDIVPIMKGWWVSCHQPGGDGYNASGLDLTSYDGLTKGTKFGAMVIPEQPDSSSLIALKPPISQENRSFLLGVPSLFLSKTSLFCGNKKRNSAEREAGPMGAKWLEVLKEAAPHLTHIHGAASSGDSGMALLHPEHQEFWRAIEAAAPRLAVEVTPGGVHDASEVERTISVFAGER